MKRNLFISAAILSLFLFSSLANAISLPKYMEFDLDNWTRLYMTEHIGDNGDGGFIPYAPVPIGNAPSLGDMSRAFITFNDISKTGGGFPFVETPGGADGPAVWVGGATDGTYLHGWEDNLVINYISSPQGDGSINIYFTHADSSSWEFEVYQTGVSWEEFTGSTNYLGAGPTMFDTIQTNLATAGSSVPFVRGRFAESLYNDPIDGAIVAVAAINIPSLLLGGEWVNQLSTPYGLGVNAFVDVDPTWGIGAEFVAGFYGYSPFLGDPYDLAIQNVRLNSEIGLPQADGESWIISDDGVRGAAVPEPATMLLLGTGLVGIAGAARRRKDKKA